MAFCRPPDSGQVLANFRKSAAPRIEISLAMLLVALACSSCGGGAMTGGGPAPQAPSIVTQPSDQTVPLGQSATFTVTAAGTAPLTYQWSENGSPVQGATAASYTTPATGLGDNDEVFTVAVSNSVGSVASQSASLTIGPRSPAAGDLRFQQVDAPSTTSGLQGFLASDVIAGLGQFFGNIVGTPLSIGDNCGPGSGSPLDCSWGFSTFYLPASVSGIGVNYESFIVTAFPPDPELDSLASPDSVVTSLDLELADQVYAVSWMQTSQATGFEYARETIPPDQLQTVASQLGAQSRVITAVSFDSSGQAYILHYGWQSDTTTIYDASVVTTTLDSIGAAVTSLAAQGYIITALGGDEANGFVVVGTRVQGDTLPRPIMVVVPQTGTDLIPLFNSGDAIVGYLYKASDGTRTWIGEH